MRITYTVFPFYAINNHELIHSIFGSHFTSVDNSVYSKCKEFDEMDDIDYDNEMFGDTHNQLVMGLQYNRSLHCKYYGEEDLNERIVHTNTFL